VCVCVLYIERKCNGHMMYISTSAVLVLTLSRKCELVMKDPLLRLELSVIRRRAVKPDSTSDTLMSRSLSAHGSLRSNIVYLYLNAFVRDRTVPGIRSPVSPFFSDTVEDS
jgi:hypothetical protein